RVDDLDRVRARLLLHDQAHRVVARAVGRRFLFHPQPTQPTRLLERIFDVTDVLDANRLAAAIGNDQLLEILGPLDAPHRAHDAFLRSLVEPAARLFLVFANQRLTDVFDRQPVVLQQLIRIDADVYRPLTAADEDHGADARDRFQFFLDLLLGNLGH